MFVSDIGLKPVVTVSKDATIEEVAHTMREHHVGCVVVTKEDQHLSDKLIPIGVITDRDVVIQTTGQGANPEKLCAEDLMAVELFTVQKDAGLGEVIRMMNNKVIRRIPVVDEKNHLVGIITSDDVFAYLAAAINAVAKVSHAQRVWEKETRR
jgi:CBS domain-containing protein